MKNLIKIVFILGLIVSISSCSKTEVEGLEEVVVNTKSKIDTSEDTMDEITEEQKVRLDRQLRHSEDEGDNDGVTDDDDDEDGDEEDDINKVVTTQ